MHEAAQSLRLEATVGMRDKGPRQPEDARIAKQRSLSQLWQEPIVARWQVLPNLTNLLFNQVVVVEQPLGRRRDDASGSHRSGNIAIRREQRGFVVAQARNE